MGQENQYMDRTVICIKEKVSFPLLKRQNIVARIDSGAKSTSVHCDKIWEETFGGKKVLCCHFLKRAKKVTRFRYFKKRRVKSSNGTLQVRYVVRVTIQLGSVVKKTEVTLTDRSTMNFSVLLGRRYLKDDFLIDVSQSYVLNK